MLRRLMLGLAISAVFAACGTTSSMPSPSATPGSPSPDTTPSPAPSAPSAPTAAPSLTGGGDPASIGRAFISLLSGAQAATATDMEDAAMRAAAPAAKLDQLWQTFVGQFGAFMSIGSVTTAVQPPYTNVTVETEFANATVALVVTVDADGRVAGLHVGQVTGPASGGTSPGPAASPATYVDPGSFTETDVTVGSAPWALPGTLSVPNGAGPFPAVVLVAGSGPEDRDETIGPNKPLRDIAWGLASAGIAVLRYDKRTLVHAAAMTAGADSVTVRQETTDDAHAAIELLRTTPKVDPARVFLVGHSLGGYLAPRIAAQAPGQLRGIGLLEANSTPLPRLIGTQVAYLASLQGSPTPSAEQQLANLLAQVALADSPSLSPSTPTSELPLGVPASYWLDLRTYDPLATAADLRIPMFFSQGERDYQVPPGELAAWQKALAGRTDVTFRTYPALDHLLFAGSGPATPAEYATPGQHVAPELVADLAAWVKGS